MPGRRCGFSGSGVLATGALAVVALLTGCGRPAPQQKEQTRPVQEPSPRESVPPAVYYTGVTFAGFRPVPGLAHLRLENRTGESFLYLWYRGWISDGGEWLPLLTRTDSLPVPRAAWRVVPSGPLRLRVGEGARLVSIRLTDGESMELRSKSPIASWSSQTGQREMWLTAERRDSSLVEPGLLLVQRRARLESDSVGGAVWQSLLLGDTLGSGLLVLRDGSRPDAPAAVWTWLDGTAGEWPEATVLSLAAPEGSAGRWSVEIPSIEVVAEVEGDPAGVDELPEEGPGFKVFRLAGTLARGTERRPMAGIGIEERGP